MHVYDWSKDRRITMNYGGLIAEGDTASGRRKRLVDDCYGQIVHLVADLGLVVGQEEVPLLFAASMKRNAALLSGPRGPAILITDGFMAAAEEYLARALGDAAFLSEYLPESMFDGLTEERRDFGTEILCHMIDFAIHHEIAHDIREHVALLHGADSTSLIDEMLMFDAIADGDELPRLIEFDADLHALNLQMGEFRRHGEIASWPEAEMEDAFFKQLLAMIFVGQILDHRHTSVEEHGRFSHPAPIHRSILYAEVMVESFSEAHPWGRAKFDNLHDQAWYEASVAAAANGYPEGRWRGSEMGDARFDLLLSLREAAFEFSRRQDERLAT